MDVEFCYLNQKTFTMSIEPEHLRDVLDLCSEENSRLSILSASCDDPAFLVIMNKPARLVSFQGVGPISIAENYDELFEKVHACLDK